MKDTLDKDLKLPYSEGDIHHSVINDMEKKVSFGFEDIPLSKKTPRVQRLFEKVAPHYDKMNDLMSFGLHRVWKRDLLRHMALYPHMEILDLAGGTGDVAMSLHRATKTLDHVNITVADLNPAMLHAGYQKALDQGITNRLHWVCANAETLPFQDNHFDGITLSFGARNFTNLAKSLQEVLRVLKPGGRFYCLEFSHIQDPLLRPLYHAYAHGVIPKMGGVIAQDQGAYRYLVESIERFLDPHIFVKLMDETGFFKPFYKPFMKGLVCLHQGQKPLSH